MIQREIGPWKLARAKRTPRINASKSPISNFSDARKTSHWQIETSNG
jgi:hypothetical protein